MNFSRTYSSPEELLNIIVHSINGTLVYTPKLHITYVNDTMLKFWNKDVGKRLIEIIYRHHGKIAAEIQTSQFKIQYKS